MPSSVQHTIFANQAVDVDEHDLKQLDAIMSGLDSESRVRYSISTRDDARITFESLKELLDFPNSDERAIESIQVSATSPKLVYTTTLSLEPDSTSYSVRLIAQGEDDSRLYLFKREVLAWLKQIRPWYSSIAARDSMVFWLVLFAPSILVQALLADRLWKHFYGLERKMSDGTASWLLILMILLSVPISLGVTWIIRRVLPRATFRIGWGGKKRAARTDTIQSVVLIGILLAVAINIATSLLLS
jgi:hypothetical protein